MRTLLARAALLLVLGVALASPMGARAQGRGRVDCAVSENGGAATGSLVVLSGTTEVGRGSCGRGAQVPPGAYTVRVVLDGALDGASIERQVTVRAGGAETVRADFAIGTLEVAVSAGGRRAAAQAEILKNGQRVGVVSAGVAARISAGTYDVIVRYRGEERRFAGVSVAPGERRVVSAEY